MEQNKQETVFLNGFIFKRPKEGAPDFVKGEMAINVADAVKFLQENSNNGWINADLLASKDNSKLYFKLNTWTPPAKDGEAPQNAPQATTAPVNAGEDTRVAPPVTEEDINPDDIPF